MSKETNAKAARRSRLTLRAHQALGSVERADRWLVVDAEYVRGLRRSRGIRVNPWSSFPRLIVSIDWLKRPRAMAMLREVLPPGVPTYPLRFDLLVIDEVHLVAPSGRGKYATDSLRTKGEAEHSET